MLYLASIESISCYLVQNENSLLFFMHRNSVQGASHCHCSFVFCSVQMYFQTVFGIP